MGSTPTKGAAPERSSPAIQTESAQWVPNSGSGQDMLQNKYLARPLAWKTLLNKKISRTLRCHWFVWRKTFCSKRGLWGKPAPLSSYGDCFPLHLESWLLLSHQQTLPLPGRSAGKYARDNMPQLTAKQ